MTDTDYLGSGFGIICIGMFVAVLFYRYQRIQEKAQERKEKSDERLAQIEGNRQTAAEQANRRQGEDLRMLLSTVLAREEKKEKPADVEQPGPNSGGYIIFNMPNSEKSMFHDLLKGFEDYARLRGYVISFSIDNSFENQVAFKFSLDSQGINVSRTQVRQDLKEYIERVRTGESLDDLPVIISQWEHDLVLSHMKARISMLQHNYNLEKTYRQTLEGLINQFPKIATSIGQPQNIYIGDRQNNQQMLAYNSPQAAVGMGNRVIENRIDQSIYIADSFIERDEQIKALSTLWMAIYHEAETLEGEAKEKAAKARELIQKVENEMKEGEPPEANRLTKWLTQAKGILGTIAIATEVAEKAKKVWDSFGMP